MFHIIDGISSMSSSPVIYHVNYQHLRGEGGLAKLSVIR